MALDSEASNHRETRDEELLSMKYTFTRRSFDKRIESPMRMPTGWHRTHDTISIAICTSGDQGRSDDEPQLILLSTTSHETRGHIMSVDNIMLTTLCGQHFLSEFLEVFASYSKVV